MTERLWFIFDVWLAMMAAALLHMGVAWVALRQWGGGAPEIGIFYGKPLATIHWRGTAFRLGWIPLGMYVKFNESVFPYLPWRVRVILPLLGPLAITIGAGLLLGLGNAWEQLERSFGQLFQMAIHPINVTVPLFERVRAAELPWSVFTGLLWTRCAAFQFFPVPGLAGSAWWTEAFRRPPEDKVIGWLGVMGFFILLPVWIGFAVAACRFVAGGAA